MRRRKRALDEATAKRGAPVSPAPPFRRLRGYAFDPSLSLQLETALINEVVFKVIWEPSDQFGPGPVGEYVEVIDYDPPSGCCYAPVDLNNRELLAQDGLPPAEGNPQFHQQMVYAVAMTTIRNFERALGRRTLWAPRQKRGKRGRAAGDEYVPRLRIYPHALREANAYYSPHRKALLFGYFPSQAGDGARQLPGGMIFTCLSHDIIAHETTHALLDGLHRGYIENSNPDSLAFHEAFADLVALFQHFSFPEVLRHQIARRRGDLESQSLLGELAQEFGRAVGGHGALRDALGSVNPATGVWERRPPDPDRIQTVMECHARGAILVAAVFDAFLAIYRARVADLFRLATSGTGVLPAGAIHPDLVQRLAEEAAKSAQHVLNMCVRALDYCPPVDLTFGDYLRAIVTADADLVPDDDRNYRIAFIDAFRQHGIYPQDVRALSAQSLLWQQAADRGQSTDVFAPIAQKLRPLVHALAGEPMSREHLYHRTRAMCRQFQRILTRQPRARLLELERITGLWLSPSSRLGLWLRSRSGKRIPTIEVHTVRWAQRVGPDGDAINQLVILLTQKQRVRSYWWDGFQEKERSELINFRGGCTLVLDLDGMTLKYAIKKSLYSQRRLSRMENHLRLAGTESLRSTYFGPARPGTALEPFALMHRGI